MHLPLTLTLSPRREERRGERGRALPRRRGGRSSPSPHRSSRWGEGRGEGQKHARTARPIAAHAAANAMVPQSPHVLLPLTLTLSPRREERRGERGRALPPRRDGRPSPLPIVLHGGERVGVRGRSTHGRPRPIAAHAAANAMAPQSPHVPLPLTLTLSPRREERRGERGTRVAAAPQRRTAPLPLPIVLHDGERAGVRGRSTHGRPDRSPLTRRRCDRAPEPSRAPAPHPNPLPTA